MKTFTSDGGMIRKRIWDPLDIPDRSLYFGRPAVSGMSLISADAEYINLAGSIRDGGILDVPPGTAQCYHSLGKGKDWRVADLAPAVVHWTVNHWQTAHDLHTSDAKAGVHVTDLDRDQLYRSDQVEFASQWPEANRWDGRTSGISL
jgi:glucoamylase